ncbi:MAG: hypothetical protein ACYSWS_01185 [Planctomycetota bacterium]
MKGFDYIHYLLSTPNHEFYVLDLVHEIKKILPPKDIYNGVNTEETEGQLIEENLTLSSSDSTGEIMDKETIKDCENRRAELLIKLSDAIELKNDEAAAEIKDEIEKINKQLNAGRDKRGQPRKFSSNTEKTRKSVSKAYKTSLKKIKDGHPALWKHFKNTLTIGISCSYKPEKPMSWEL